MQSDPTCMQFYRWHINHYNLKKSNGQKGVKVIHEISLSAKSGPWGWDAPQEKRLILMPQLPNFCHSRLLRAKVNANLPIEKEITNESTR